MDISKIVIDPRHRNHWSAIDLGFILARKWYKQLLQAWCMASLPLFLLLLLLPKDLLWLSILIIWWLKPLWDRGPLLIASRELFSEQLPIKPLFFSYQQLLQPGLLHWLTIYRFSPGRSFLQPIHVLEKLSGKRFRERSTVLQRNMRSSHVYLTLACVHFEAILSIGLLSFIALLIPNEMEIDYWDWLAQQQSVYLYLTTIASYIAMALVAPFYCVAGFMLYINRRILLEGWDIEINFRLLAERLQHTSTQQNARQNSTSVTALLLCCLFLSLLPDASSAAPENHIEQIESAEQAKALIEKIYAGPEYHQEYESTHYRLRFPNNKTDEESDDNEEHPFLNWLAELLGNWISHSDEPSTGLSSLLTIANIIKIVLIALAIALLAYLFYQAHQWYLLNYQDLKRQLPTNTQKPESLFGFEVRENSLPENLADTVNTLWFQGAHREAIALLYRAVLTRLLHDYHFVFSDAFTEQECAELVERSEDESHQPLKAFIWQLTRHWQSIAYAHHSISDATASSLIEQYQGLFNDER